MLVERGYTVQRGAYEFFSSNCEDVESCFVLNPTANYGLTFLPEGPRENVADFPWWGSALNIEVGGVKMSATYRLEADETVVTLGQTPPRCLYYSFLPYVYSRYHPPGWKSSCQSCLSKCPDVTDSSGGRCAPFASLGDPINMLNINSSYENGQSYNSEFAHFIGGNKAEVAKFRP